VNWDLIPGSAISTINLIPGSNPLFGLNTLGGALSIRTKSGAQYPGTAATLYGGSFGRRAVEAQHGRRERRARLFCERERISRGRVARAVAFRRAPVFTKLGWQDGTSDLDLSITHAESDLTGNGLLPQSMVRDDPKQAYTLSDHTRNRMTLFSLNATRWLTGDLLWSSTVYYRQSEKSHDQRRPQRGQRSAATASWPTTTATPTHPRSIAPATSQRVTDSSTQAALTSGNLSGRAIW